MAFTFFSSFTLLLFEQVPFSSLLFERISASGLLIEKDPALLLQCVEFVEGQCRELILQEGTNRNRNRNRNNGSDPVQESGDEEVPAAGGEEDSRVKILEELQGSACLSLNLLGSFLLPALFF